MKKLSILSTLSLLLIGTALFACGDNDDPYNSTRTIDDSGEPGSWSRQPNPGTGGGGGPSTGDAGIDNKLLLKDLNARQTEALCDANYEKYKDHDDPGLPVGLGACLDFAARRGNLLGFEYPEQLMICEEEFIDCYTFPPQTAPPASCINPQAQRTCEATVEEFENCGTEDARILTTYFLQLADQTCSVYASDEGIEELDALLTSFHQPPACASLLTRCPNLFD